MRTWRLIERDRLRGTPRGNHATRAALFRRGLYWEARRLYREGNVDALRAMASRERIPEALNVIRFDEYVDAGRERSGLPLRWDEDGHENVIPEGRIAR